MRGVISYFNNYVVEQLKGTVPPTIPMDIFHQASQATPGLQAVDMYSWGFFRKYERKDDEWFEVFKEKVIFDEVYLPEK